MINSLKYKDYTAAISYNANDEVFFGQVSGIKDLISFEGTSVSELKQAFEEAIEDYLQTCLSLNKSPDKVYKGVFNVRVPPSLHKKIASYSVQYAITLNDFVKNAIVYAINHEEEFNISIKSEE